VPSYLVEMYVPGSHPREARRTALRLEAAAGELGGRKGVRVRYLRTMFLPDDDTCFHLVHASGPAAVGALCRRAGLRHARVVRAVEISPPPPARTPSPANPKARRTWSSQGMRCFSDDECEDNERDDHALRTVHGDSDPSAPVALRRIGEDERVE
jgi:hypothetical protein